jgi:hypothetical protein
MFFVIILFSPFFLVFFAPVALCAMCVKSFRRCGGCIKFCCFFWFLPILFVLGLAADVVIIPAAIIVGIPIYLGNQIK